MYNAPEIRVSEARRLASEGRAVLLDVRSARAYGRHHLPGALNLPFAEFGPQVLELIDDLDAQVIVYCYIGVASANVTSQMLAMGYANVRSLAGGHALCRLLWRG